MRSAVSFSNWWNDTSWSWVAEYIATGTDTSPNVIDPVQIGRAMAAPSGQRWKLLRMVEHVAEQVAALAQPGQDRADREAVRPQRRIVELVPLDRRGDRRPGGRPRAVRGDQRLVDRVLGVVEPGPATPVAALP